MSDIPSVAYRLLWEERQVVSVANLTRQDGIDFLQMAPKIGVVTTTTAYPPSKAQQSSCHPANTSICEKLTASGDFIKPMRVIAHGCACGGLRTRGRV